MLRCNRSSSNRSKCTFLYATDAQVQVEMEDLTMHKMYKFLYNASPMAKTSAEAVLW